MAGRPKSQNPTQPVTVRLVQSAYDFWQARADKAGVKIHKRIQQSLEDAARPKEEPTIQADRNGEPTNVTVGDKTPEETTEDCRHPINLRIGKACRECGKDPVK